MHKIRIRVYYEPTNAGVLLMLLPGANAHALDELADALARKFPQALIAAVISEGAALNEAALAPCLARMQQQFGISAQASAVFGFAEQAGLALNALQLPNPPSRAFVIAPLAAYGISSIPNQCTAHFFAFAAQSSTNPQQADATLNQPMFDAWQGYQWLHAQGADVSFTDLAELSQSQSWQSIADTLASYVPKHYFEEAAASEGQVRH